MDNMVRGMNLLMKLNWQMIGTISQLRVSQVHNWDNLIVINDNEPVDDVLDAALVPVPGLVEHQLVPIKELTDSTEDSELGEESGDEVWEITHKEFVGSSPEL